MSNVYLQLIYTLPSLKRLKSKYGKVCVLPIWIVKSNVSSVGPLTLFFFSDEGPTLETLDFTIRIGSTPTFLYFDFVSEHCLRSTLRLFH